MNRDAADAIVTVLIEVVRPATVTDLGKNAVALRNCDGWLLVYVESEKD